MILYSSVKDGEKSMLWVMCHAIVMGLRGKLGIEYNNVFDEDRQIVFVWLCGEKE